MTYVIPAAAIVGAFVLALLGLGVPVMATVGFVGLLAWARNSAARLAGLSVVAAIAVPLIPEFQETRTPQVTAYSVVFLLLLAFSLSLLRRRGKRMRLPIVVLSVLAGLPLLTVGLAGFDQFRLLAGMVVAIGLALAISVGLAADASERQSIFKTLTLLAYATAAIAVYEEITKTPLYEFTAFQVQGNARSAFRAGSLFGHPLVLCVFMAFVAVTNMTRPMWDKRDWLFARVPSVVVPLAGAAASGSRSILLMVGVGIFAMLFSRRDAGSSKAARFGFATLAVVLGVLGLQPGSLLSGRFDQLSVQEQAIRLSGFDVVSRITHGAAMIVGDGPRAVANASHTYSFAAFRTVDNQFFTAYADYGLVGAILVLALILIVLSGLRRRGLDPWQRTAAVAGSIFLPAFFLTEPLSWSAIAVLFGLAVGISAGAPTNKEPRLSSNVDQRVTPRGAARFAMR